MQTKVLCSGRSCPSHMALDPRQMNAPNHSTMSRSWSRLYFQSAEVCPLPCSSYQVGESLLPSIRGTLVVKVTVIGCEVVDDSHSLSHEVHQVFWVRTAKVVLSEDGSNTLSKDETSVRNCVLVTKNNTDLRGAHTLFAYLTTRDSTSLASVLDQADASVMNGLEEPLFLFEMNTFVPYGPLGAFLRPANPS